MQSEPPLVTVAFPAFNHEKFVEQALDSTLRSGLPAVEVVICDDASTDGTAEVIRQWGSAHQHELARFVFIEHQSNRGLCASLNDIVSEARGEIIHVSGTDDYFLPGGLAAKTRAMVDHPEWDGVFCDGQAVSLEGNVYAESLIASGRMNEARLEASTMDEDLLYSWSEPVNLHSWRRRVFKRHGGEFEWDPTIYCEDFEITMWAASRKRLGFVPQVCQAYRCRSWPQVTDRPMQRVHRDVAHVLAKSEKHCDPRLAIPMRNLREAFFKTALGDREGADIHWLRHQELRELYLQRIRAEKSAPAAAAPAEPVSPTPLEMPLISYAGNAGDILLWRALRSVHRGFYIDVGADHPTQDSLTQLFYEWGWSGINIQPSASKAQEFPKARPRDLNLMLAVAETTGTRVLHEEAGGSSESLSYIVPSETLANLCEQHVSGDIHLLRIHATGLERQVLEGARLQTFRPWLVAVAFPPGHPGSFMGSWEPSLLAQGYEFLRFDGCHAFYASREKSEALRPHFLSGPSAHDGYVVHGSVDTHDYVRQLHAEMDRANAANQDRLQRSKWQLSKLKEELRSAKAEIFQLRHQLRHHSANLWRALRFWWGKKKLFGEVASEDKTSAGKDGVRKEDALVQGRSDISGVRKADV